MDRDNIKATARKAGHIIDSKAYARLTVGEQAALLAVRVMAEKYGPLFMDELLPAHSVGRVVDDVFPPPPKPLSEVLPLFCDFCGKQHGNSECDMM
tara:strand:- start:169 stop:456 length:288 start_codon:yes stop_codon:yes gene_type:complete